MAVSIPHTFVNTTIIEASEVNANFSALKLFVDSLQTGANLDTSTISTAKLVDASVTEAKIADASVTASKLASGVIPAGDYDQYILGAQVFV
jgi:uncharacterized protein YjbI with pentapeptide repeats